MQSSAKHRGQIENDAIYTASDAILLGETWAMHADEINISGYKTVARVDCTRQARRACGACYLLSQRLLSDVRDPAYIRIGENEDWVDAAVLKLRHVLIAGAYANPRVTVGTIRSFLERCSAEEEPKLILGDFNHNIIEAANSRFKETVEGFGLKIWNVNVPNENITLDLVVSNFSISHGTYVSLTSFRQPIWDRYDV
ncbi:unnamed protein product [Gongylonema pulchrum]|uniref:Endo/exonuclease/phosphatase domain-containing protein n=1 Tax=Gongylonema pulchrum TaxID=637853 RepID=A0A183DZT2_9BILA|nr:unnamed protein product [Gongylonema pulchrum]